MPKKENLPKTKGRPTKYTEELADKIMNAIATTPDGLERICKNNPDFPTHQTIKNWIVEKPDFFARYLRAKEQQALFIADGMWEDAKNLPAVSEEISRFTAVFRFQQWHLAQLAPKQFSDRGKKDDSASLNIHITHEQALRELAGDEAKLIEDDNKE